MRIRDYLLSGKAIDLDEVLNYLDEVYKMIGLADRSSYMRDVVEGEAPTIIKVKLLLSGLSEDLADHLERKSKES